MRLAIRQGTEERPPESHPGDFVLRDAAGSARFRKADESPDAFRERVEHDER